MKDQNKIKEKENKSEFKMIFLIGIIFLVAFGLIVYGIVKLTNEYFSLKSQLSEKTAIEKSASTKDNGGQIVLQSDNIKLETVNNEKQGATDNKAASQKQPEQAKQSTPQVNTEKKGVVLDADKGKESKKLPEKSEKIEKTEKNTEKSATQPESVKKEAVKESKKTAEENKQKAKQDTENKAQKDALATKSSEKDNNASKKDVSKRQQVDDKKAESKPSAPASGRFALQLMSFKDKQTADKEAERLKSSIKDIYVLKVDLGEKGIWYRLRCCSAATKEELNAKKEKIKKETGINAIPVTN
jgi:cell division septation protein DedD